MDQEHYPVVIIGAGPAGLAAAMQLTRQGHQALVLERDRVGGLLWNANLVENYPGFIGGISGPALVGLFQDQAQALGVRIAIEEARLEGFEGDYFRIGTNKRELTSRILVAATGTKARRLADRVVGPGLEDRVFSEVYPLLGTAGKRVIILGGGDAAFDYGLNLARKNQVVILNRGEEIKALGLLVDRALAHPQISYHSQAALESLHEHPKGGLKADISLAGENTQLEGDYLIAAIGREPELSFAAPSIINEIENLRQEHRLYLIGDLKNGLYRQTAIAVGDGLRAAMEIDQYLSKEKI